MRTIPQKWVTGDLLAHGKALIGSLLLLRQKPGLGDFEHATFGRLPGGGIFFHKCLEPLDGWETLSSSERLPIS